MSKKPRKLLALDVGENENQQIDFDSEINNYIQAFKQKCIIIQPDNTETPIMVTKPL